MHFVICPYNRPEYGPNLLACLGRQSFRGFVPVIVENGPGVGTIAAPPGGAVIRSDAHQSAAKNAGLEWVRKSGGGSWSVFDCDDYYGPGYLGQQVAALEEGELAGKMCESFMYTMFDDGLYLDGVKRSGSMLIGGGMNCRTADVPDFPMSALAEDVIWHSSMVKRGARAVNTGARHYCYDRRGTGHTWDPEPKIFEDLRKKMLFLGDLPLSACDMPTRAVVGAGGQAVAKVVMLHTPDYVLAEVSVPDMRLYCRMWDYDLEVHTEMARPEWPAAWNKVLAVLAAMESVKEGEWVLWTDCDVLMSQHRVPLETMTDPGKDLMLSEDKDGICTGFFLVRNVPLMRQFMSDMMKDVRKDWPWEQDVAKELLESRPEYAERTGKIPDSVVQNPLSRRSKEVVANHYWGHLYEDRKKLLERMRIDILFRDNGGGSRYRRPWMRRG